MPQQVDIEHDPFLTLLTEALRAGPASPQWHEAVTKLKSTNGDGGGGPSLDEYKLLIEARQALESGKDYRSVRAGTGFTRRLMDDLEGERTVNARRISIPTLIALLAGFVIVAILGIAAFEFYPRTPIKVDSSQEIDELASTYFSRELVTSTFDMGVPVFWREIGSLPLESSGGLKPGMQAAPEGEYIGGGIVTADPVPAGSRMSMQVTLLVDRPGDDLIPQVFASNSADFSSDRAISSQELVWQLQGNAQKVVVDGRVEHQSAPPARGTTRTVRLLLTGDLAVIESDGKRLWAGHSGLDARPRSLGVRFIRTSGKPVGQVTIQSVRIFTTSQ